MLNAYISKEDITELLKEFASINGLINKREFQKAIITLKEHKKPQPNKAGDRVNQARAVIANITKYQNGIILGKITSDIMDKAISGIGESIHTISYIKIYIDRRTCGNEKSKDVVSNTRRLASILGISIPTVHKWMKKNIIIRHIPHEVWYYISANKDVRGRLYVPYYYDLEEIKNNIKYYK